jgi:hypothetical protein
MRFIDKKYLIKNIAERWRVMYEPFRTPEFRDRKAIYEKLKNLDTSKATEYDIAVILEDQETTWTSIKCKECGNDVDCCIAFGCFHPHFEVCPTCLQKAVELLSLPTKQTIWDKIKRIYRNAI